MKGKVLGRRRLAAVAGIVTPDTILRWYRTLVAKKYDGSKARRRGRPSTKADLAALVVRMATENPTWGHTRIRGGSRFSVTTSPATIEAILTAALRRAVAERRRSMARNIGKSQ